MLPNVAICIPEMKHHRRIEFAAFTLIELLVVIAIIAIVAGLVVGLSGVAGEKKRIARAQVERDRLLTLIESYKLKLGVYPPQNPDPNKAGRNTLLYELAGAYRNMSNPGNPLYETPFPNIVPNISSNELYQEFGVRGLVNASEDKTEIKRFLKRLKPDQFARIGNAFSLVIPIDDPGRNQPNPWKYLWDTNAFSQTTSNVLHNPDGFDLWVEIYSRGKTNPYGANCIVIGNWKE